MIHIYYLLLLVLTASSSVIATLYGPQLLTRIKRYFTRIKRQPPVDCTLLASRVAILEKKITKRESNYRHAIRQEITNILIELKNK